MRSEGNQRPRAYTLPHRAVAHEKVVIVSAHSIRLLSSMRERPHHSHVEDETGIVIDFSRLQRWRHDGATGQDEMIWEMTRKEDEVARFSGCVGEVSSVQGALVRCIFYSQGTAVASSEAYPLYAFELGPLLLSIHLID